MVMMVISTHQMEGLSNKTSLENNKDSKEGSNSKDHLASLTKVPTQNAPESLVDLLIKIKSTALDAKNWPHAKRLSRTKQISQEDTSGPKKFEDYTIWMRDWAGYLAGIQQT